LETRVITPSYYYQEITKPTVDEFLMKNGDIRLAMLACQATLHVLDYIFQSREPDPKKADKLLGKFKKDIARKVFAFEVVEGFALASKHCTLSSKPDFNSGRYMVAYPSFAGTMVAGQSFLGDTVGGITIRWTDHGHVNLTTALQATLAFYETEFPELN
jgi:hypothetical protein